MTHRHLSPAAHPRWLTHPRPATGRRSPAHPPLVSPLPFARGPLLIRAAALASLVVLAACGGGDGAETPSPRSELAPVAFMAGCWAEPARAEEQGRLEERWTPADADLMLGTGRVLRDGRVVSFEFMRIQATADGIVYTPYPGGEESVPFRLRARERDRAVFENPDHDFPQRIIYRRTSEGGLAVRVEDARRGNDWTLEPVPCEGG